MLNKHEGEAGGMKNVFTYLLTASCRFGFDVPVILRSSDDTESVLPTPEKQMVQVTNPFSLLVGCGPASVKGEQ